MSAFSGRNYSSLPLVVLCLLPLFLHSGLAQNNLDVVSQPVPETVSEAVRKLLSDTSHQVRLGGENAADFWFRSEIPLEGTVAGTLGVNFEQIESSTLLGVVRLHREWEDYKGMPVRPGVYTLRYGVIPADGNHMGVSVYRDFVVLAPVDKDLDPVAKFDFDGLTALSREASGTNHPAVMAIFPMWDGVEKASLVQNEIDQLTLAVKLGSLEFGLVVQGHGEM